MSTTLTEFVRHLSPDRSGEPSDELAEQMWSALRGLLAAEMKRRSCWSNPPQFLGVIGHATWTSADPTADALDELAARCFEYVFLKRRSSLCDQAQRKPTVDGLVALAIRQFVFEQQRLNDPLGFRLFEVLRRVVDHAIQNEQLCLIAGDPRIRNDSLIARLADCTPAQIRAVDPSPLADRWVTHDLDSLVTASHRALSDLIQRLGVDLVSWLDEGLGGFRFGDLAAELKTRGRALWVTRYLDAVTDNSAAFGDELDPARRFAAISTCVRRSIEDFDTRAKTRRYLERVWRFLEVFASDQADDDFGSLVTDTLPSHRQLSRLLEIPRERLPGLIETLGRQVQVCRNALDAGPPEALMPSPASEPAYARAQAALRATVAAQPSDRPLRRGDIVALPVADVVGVSWLVLTEPDASTCRCAPVDGFALLGERDVPLETTTGEPWFLRLRFERTVSSTWLAEGTVVATVPVDQITAEALGAIDPLGYPVDDAGSLAYDEWIDEGPAEAARLLDEHGRVVRTSPPSPLWPARLAAVFALAVIGLGLYTGQLRTRLYEPIVGLPYREVGFGPDFRGPQRLTLDPSATHVQINLVPSSGLRADSYRAVILDAAGKLVYESDWIEDDEISLTFPASSIRNDPLEIQLLGLIDGSVRTLDTQSVEWLE